MRIKNFEIFCGTGGVGKTTLATSRALFLSAQDKKVLLITIDPAKRLKQVLNLEGEAGEVVSISNPLDDSHTLDVILMNPQKTMLRISQMENAPEIAENKILKILTRPYGGMNEILSIVELFHQYQSQKYDVIILDTPPGSHFLDFLESCSKIKAFFDASFVEVFSYLGDKLNKGKKSGFLNKIVNSSIKKLLSYLEKVTGADFIDDFIEALTTFYKAKRPFLDAIQLQEQLSDIGKSNWFLITSVDHNKYKEAIELKSHAQHYFHHDTFVILNKSTQDYWDQFHTEDTNVLKLKNNMLGREKKLKEQLEASLAKTFSFNDIDASDPLEQVKQLAKSWENVK